MYIADLQTCKSKFIKKIILNIALKYRKEDTILKKSSILRPNFYANKCFLL